MIENYDKYEKKKKKVVESVKQKYSRKMIASNFQKIIELEK